MGQGPERVEEWAIIGRKRPSYGMIPAEVLFHRPATSQIDIKPTVRK